MGGLGIPNLRDLNICLLASWIKRYNVDGHKLWKQFIDHKYDTNRPNLFCSSTNGASQFFKGVMWAASATKLGFRWKIGNGKKVKFWEDNWLGHSLSNFGKYMFWLMKSLGLLLIFRMGMS